MAILQPPNALGNASQSGLGQSAQKRSGTFSSGVEGKKYTAASKLGVSGRGRLAELRRTMKGYQEPSSMTIGLSGPAASAPPAAAPGVGSGGTTAGTGISSAAPPPTAPGGGISTAAAAPGRRKRRRRRRRRGTNQPTAPRGGGRRSQPVPTVQPPTLASMAGDKADAQRSYFAVAQPVGGPPAPASTRNPRTVGGVSRDYISRDQR